MGIFANILNKIFPSSHPAVQGGASATPGTVAADAPTTPSSGSAATPTAPPVDVEAILTDLASKNPEKLNWRTSIVDLMKLLGLDSSLANRKELAQELHFGGDMNDSAAMNTWLQKQVMQKLAANGGKVPADLTN